MMISQALPLSFTDLDLWAGVAETEHVSENRRALVSEAQRHPRLHAFSGSLDWLTRDGAPQNRINRHFGTWLPDGAVDTYPRPAQISYLRTFMPIINPHYQAITARPPWGPFVGQVMTYGAQTFGWETGESMPKEY